MSFYTQKGKTMIGYIKKVDDAYEIKVTGVDKNGEFRTRFIIGANKERVIKKAYEWLISV